ncbi:MAG: hypothetical protein JXQ75_04650 [Phycisphaerae bacterium]|nr:hypothetical protein [Phycisphaerae bacterium]
MTDCKVRVLAGIEARARREAEILAGEFARAASAEREEILAALEAERWLAEACWDCRPTADRRPGEGF